MSDRDAQIPEGPMLEAAVEAIVFASGEPVQPKDVAAALGTSDLAAVKAAFAALEARYESSEGGLRIERVAGAYRMATRPEVGGWVRGFFRHRNRTRLTPSTLETLAIVAYRQPITAPEIQSIRGRDPSYALRTLLEKRMIRILGRKKVVGNPLLYGTTKQFLVHFGLDRLEDLPSIEDFDGMLGALGDGQARLFSPDETAPEEQPTGEPTTGDVAVETPDDVRTSEDVETPDDAVDSRKDFDRNDGS